jgi:hypothetical protein
MINTDHKGNVVYVTVFGEFTLADYREFEDLVRYKLKFVGPVSLYFDLRQMADFTLDVALEEVRFSLQHAHDFRRIAVLTTSQWATWAAWLSQVFVDADLRVFDEDEAARGWLEDSVSQLA